MFQRRGFTLIKEFVVRTAIRQGIHVFVRKAVVDAEFRALLLARRAEAAKEIDLKLSPAEEMLLAAVPAAQVEAIIGGCSEACQRPGHSCIYCRSHRPTSTAFH
jgi:hypothetical protein